MCEELDSNGNGKLSLEEWHQAINSNRLRTYLGMLSFRPSQIEELLKKLSSHATDNELDISTFVHGCMSFRGPASYFDMQNLLGAVQALNKREVQTQQLLDKGFQHSRASTMPRASGPPM